MERDRAKRHPKRMTGWALAWVVIAFGFIGILMLAACIDLARGVDFQMVSRSSMKANLPTLTFTVDPFQYPQPSSYEALESFWLWVSMIAFTVGYLVLVVRMLLSLVKGYRGVSVRALILVQSLLFLLFLASFRASWWFALLACAGLAALTRLRLGSARYLPDSTVTTQPDTADT